MALLKIARLGHPVLRQVSSPVTDPSDSETRRLVGDMIETMRDANGAGLAAPQVYALKRIIVFHAPADPHDPDERSSAPFTVLINPEFEPVSEQKDVGWEGCLSIPGLRGQVKRWSHIRYRGIGLGGRTVEREATGFHARVVQHEIDHLDGILYPDRMSTMASLCFDTELDHFLADEDDSQDE